MYSIWPWANRQVIVVWLYMIFIVGSQLFAIAAITLWYPLSVQTERAIVDCGNATSLAPLLARGFRDAATGNECRRAGEIAFWTDLHGRQVAYYSLEMTTPFHRAVLMKGDCMVHILRLVCCAWVFSQIYFQHFVPVQSLIEYHDFSRWFLPLKGAETRNNWAVCVAFIQYSIVLIDLTVSFVVIWRTF
ncbi:unnamed protein product [Prorocentrum cordatum]|uniref:Protein S-acyltransferase n=1 Tax=Prorocentrum cordatum TaxID=2364126 RepID=A0ABN9SRN1_9DINO|nr:unnamed protein product [Polarella glacialis]